MENFSFSLIAIAVSVLGILILFMAFLSRYKRCRGDQLLVISGKTGKNTEGENRTAKVINGGATFVMPIIQEYKYLSLNPFTVDIELTKALSSQNIRIDIPSNFNVAISDKPGVRDNAARRLLSMSQDEIYVLAENIIVGQMRAVISSMTIEDINNNREMFLTNMEKQVETELEKVGLELINVNITDIKDDSGYIEALGKEAAAEVVNKAKKTVAEKNRDGAIGEANAKQDERIQVANANSSAEIGEKNADSERRTKVAEADASATEGENSSMVRVAQSNSKRQIEEAKFRKGATVAQNVNAAEAKQESYEAEKIAENKRAEKERATKHADIIIPAEIQKEKMAIDAEAEAEQIRRIAQGEADSIRARKQAEADGIKSILEGQAEGLKKIVEAAGGDIDKAMGLMIVDKLPEIMKIQSEAISNIEFDKIVVWDNGGNSDGKGSSTSNFLNNLLTGTLPMADELYKMVGKNLPSMLNVREDEVKNPLENTLETQHVLSANVKEEDSNDSENK